MSIIEKIKEAGLVGRGGACFPVWKKWEAVAEAMIKSPLTPLTEGGQISKAPFTKGGEGELKAYVICNFSEGEPGVQKDKYIIEHYPEKVIDGMKLAIDFLSQPVIPGRSEAEGKGIQKKETEIKGYIYINEEYNKLFRNKIEELIKEINIEIFVKPHEAGYIGGEESALLNTIEGNKTEPRLKPPFPVTSGLWGCPTLINNVETFYNVSLVNSGEYQKNRFYTISGDCDNTGVFELSENATIEMILKTTDNYPVSLFFVQVGGNGSGEVLGHSQLGKIAGGAASIAVYDIAKHKQKKLLLDWIEFFKNESCGQCTACREGTYRLKEIMESDKPNWQLFKSLLDNLRESSFCGLGMAVPIPIESYIRNVLSQANALEPGLDELIKLWPK